MSIKVITIDFWNTLFDSSNGIQRNQYRQQLLIDELRRFDIDLTQEEFNEALEASWLYFDSIWKNDMRTPTPQETAGFFWNYLKLPHEKSSIDYIAKEFGECIMEYPPELIPGVRKALEWLSKEYTLGIVSDTGFSPGYVLRKLLIKENLFNYFKAFSFSDETGVSKPHEKAFLTILDEMGCAPEEALHIGDIEATDIKGAKKLGMKAIKFEGDPTAQLSSAADSTIADARLDSWDNLEKVINSLAKS